MTEPSDIVRRLRQRAENSASLDTTLDEAALEIERLRAILIANKAAIERVLAYADG